MENQNFYSEMPTEEQINSLFAAFKRADASAAENTEYRMQNYFNCVDDYSWGGICDKAQDEAIGDRNRATRLLTEQLTSGAFKEIVQLSILCDLNGKQVSDKIVQGRFGACWLIGGGDNVSFVGVAKKPATYEKKGYKVMTREIELEWYYLTKMSKKGELISRARILSDTLKDAMPEHQDTSMRRELYFALN